MNKALLILVLALSVVFSINSVADAAFTNYKVKGPFDRYGLSNDDCSDGEIPKKTSGEWACGDDSGGEGSGDNVSVDSSPVVDPNFASTGDIDFVNTSNTITANLNADGVGALTDIAQSIKSAADDTSKLIVGTAGSNGEIAKWNTDGTLTDSNLIVGTLTDEKICEYEGTGTFLICDTTKSGADATVITGTAGSTGELASWNADGDLVDSNVILGTMTDGKWCTYTASGTVLSCTQDTPGGSGDVTGVGDCTGGDCFTGTTGTEILFNGTADHKFDMSNIDIDEDETPDMSALTLRAASVGTFLVIAPPLDDYDSSQTASLFVQGLGQPDDLISGDTERLILEWNPGDASYNILTSKTGTGSVRAIDIRPGDSSAMTFNANGTITASNLTASEILATDASKNLQSLAVATYPSLTELSYVKGVTSAIQTQIGAQVPDSLYDAHSVLYATSDNTPAALTVGEQTVVGRATGGNISALAIDSDLSSVSGSDDTVPSAKAVKAVTDTKQATLGNDSLTADMLKSTGQTDEYVLSYESTGDTLEWKEMTGGSITGTDTHVTFFDGANSPAGDAGFTYNKTTDSATLVGALTVATEAYDATGWNGDNTVPTKDAVRDKIETISAGSGATDLNLPVYSAKLTGAFTVFTPPTADACTQGAQIDAGDGNWRLLFDATTDECATWQFVIPSNYSSTPVLKVKYSMTSATADDVEFEGAIMCVSPDDSADIGTASFSNVAVATETVPGTAGYTGEVSISLTDDSCAANDIAFVVLSTDANDATNDDATGDREVVGVTFSYS